MVLKSFFYAFLLLGCAEVERDNPQDPNNVDGKMYSTSVINGRRWMRENLNHDVDGSMCYDNIASNCTIYGRLYNWSAAKDVCPGGWRLPTKEELSAQPYSFFSNQMGGGYFGGSGFGNTSGRYCYLWHSGGGMILAMSRYGTMSDGGGSNSDYFSVRCVKDSKEAL